MKAINERVHLLKRHLPYHESDHVLNIAYNTLVSGTCLDDIELRRDDEAFMDGIGVERIPDPRKTSIEQLKNGLNALRSPWTTWYPIGPTW